MSQPEHGANDEGAALSRPFNIQRGPASGGQWAITTGCWRTRRKTYCYVTDPEGRVRFASRRFWPCVHFLAQEDVLRYIIRPDEDEPLVAPHIVVDRER